MKTRCTVALSMFAGAALGAAAIHGLHAQDKPKAYVVSEIEPFDTAPKPRSRPLFSSRKRLR